jgi:hypothetical protein
MITKWKWIRKYCKRQGFEKAAEIADQMDRVLCYLYGEVDTDEWKSYMNDGVDSIRETGDIGLSVIDVRSKIVASSHFCIACKVDGRDGDKDVCGNCRFNELTGRDDTHMPLYNEFCVVYNVESGIMEG